MDFLFAHSWRVLLAATLLALVAGYRTALTYGQLRSELEELLPATSPSVVALEQARERLLGLRHVAVVVDIDAPHDADAALRFISDLEQRVRGYPPGTVALARSDVRQEREFFETFALQLADPADVRALREAVEARRRWEIQQAMGTQLLDEAENPPPQVPVQAFIDKYASRLGGAARFPGDRFLSEDRRTAVLVIQTGPEVASYAADEALLSRLEEDIADLGFPAAYAPGLRMGFAGDVASRVEETRGLAADLGVSAVVVLFLVLLALYWFYLSWAAWPVLLVPVLFGTVYTFGLVALPPLGIRHLNSNTAFLSSIIIGNGINSGIILLARVQEQLKGKSSIRAALEAAIRETYRPTLAAALAASAAYASLIFTDFRGFRQFGWIGGLGMPICWATTYLVAPLLIRRWGDALAVREDRGNLSAGLAALVVERPRWVLAAFGALLVLSAVGGARRHADWLETDFSRLRRADSFVSGERYWGKRMDETLQRYLTPAVVMTASAEQAEQVARAARAAGAEDKAGGLIASVRSWNDVLPPTRWEALEEAKRLARVVSPSLLEELPAAQRARVERLLSDAALEPLDPADVPAALAAGLRDKDGRYDRNVLVFPRLGGTWDADRLAAFARDLRTLAHAVNPGAQVTGPLLLSSDIIDAMRRDGPIATAIALGVTLGVAFFAFHSLGLSLLAMASLFVGVTCMLGAAAWAGQRLNFSNFVALPITFGVAADYSINVLQRCQSSANSRMALANTGGAVALCSLTTVIGFGSLLVAQNRALFSFGALAVTGELTCLATAVLVVPAYLALRPTLLRFRSPPSDLPEPPAPPDAPRRGLARPAPPKWQP